VAWDNFGEVTKAGGLGHGGGGVPTPQLDKPFEIIFISHVKSFYIYFDKFH